MSYDDRNELTFLLADSQADQVIRWACDNWVGKPHETELEDQVYAHPKFAADGGTKDVERRLYRIRRAACSWNVYLERKSLKGRSASLKQTIIPLSELARVGTSKNTARWAGSWFCKQTCRAELCPSLQLNFRRTAFDHQTLEGPVRLTVDQQAEVKMISANTTIDEPTPQFQVESLNLVKMKYFVALPAMFKELLYEFALLPEKTSLYEQCIASQAAQMAATSDRLISTSAHRMSQCQTG